MPLEWLRIYDTGQCPAPERLFFSSGRWKLTPCHALTVALKHSVHGILLFDTGVAPRMSAANARGPSRLYSAIARFDCKPELSLVRQLERDGIAPGDIRSIILSHAHADHLGGLLDFPTANIILSRETLNSLLKARGLKAITNAILPNLIPAGLAARCRVVPSVNTFDLFNDATIQLTQLPGHASGQLGMIATIGSEKYFFIADAAWHSRTITHNELPHPVMRIIVDDWQQMLSSIATIQHHLAANPGAHLIPSHCPIATAKYAGHTIPHGE